MAEPDSVESLKATLRTEVADFCRRLRPLREHLGHFVREAHHNEWRAVFFGGTLRSLLVSRLVHGLTGRPRDIDVVVNGPPLDRLRQLLQSYITRETRFGGLQLRRDEWLFDVWPLDRTWLIVQDGVAHADFSYLPYTTFLNLEAIAVDVWTRFGCERQIYSGDDQFFRGIIDRVVEINRPENPFPELCVVRSLIMTHDLGFRVGPKLASYIADHGPAIADDELEHIQNKHYGHVRVPGNRLWRWIRFIRDTRDDNAEMRVDPAAEAMG